MAEKLRVHTLAQELGVASKEIVAKCKAEGIAALKNHMSVVSLGLSESIKEWFSEGADVTSVEVGATVDLKKVRKPRRKKKIAEKSEAEDGGAVATATAVAEPAATETGTPTSDIATVETQAVTAAPAPGEPAVATPDSAPTLIETPAAGVDTPPQEGVAAAPAIAATAANDGADAESAVAGAEEPPKPEPVELPPPEPVIPAGPQLIPKPAALSGPRVVRVESPDPIRVPRPRPRPPSVSPGPPAPPGAPPDPTTLSPGRRGKRRGAAPDESAAAKSKSTRRRGLDSEQVSGERLREWRDQDLLERRERLASATGQGMRARRVAERHRRETGGARTLAVQKTEVEISVPIFLKDFCAAISVPYARMLPKLSEHTGGMPTINEMIDGETAELIGLEFGITVKVARKKSALEELEDEVAAGERKNLQPRPPVVTMLGHVDHGKTSLLDAIRRTDVAKGEAGGITQHIGAYRIDRGDWHVTFLDTPGHKAFTEMRARGANLTDVVVLVVAADDGVMPQTIEAINHAKAAKVPIVVALNKIDLPGVDTNKLYGQLAEQGLNVVEWGGDVDIIKTSATTNVGIDELVAHLSELSDLLELKADPTVAAAGTVIEAEMREGRGIVATVLVSEGTLRTGQTIVCGPGSGRVRSLIDSSGKRLKEAGPGTPVELSGLDKIPAAGDKLYQLKDASQAKRVAELVYEERRAASLRSRPKPTTLDEVFLVRNAEGVPEHNIIIKADVDGSVEALRQELSAFPDDQVRLNILHAAVGAVTEDDIRLAETSKATVLGFHVVSDDHAQRLADEVGVEIRTYTVIYHVIDDIRKALEGLLEPELRLTPRGKAEVRQVFHLSKKGKVAGCQVVEGGVARNNKVRIVRDGRIIREDAEIASLRRFKNDVKEVASGYECGIKILGFDDLKPGDVIEAYEVTEVKRTL